VNEAKKYSGTTITIVWEAGLQSLDPTHFSGPQMEGVDRDRREGRRGVATAEMFTKIMQDYRSGAGAYDALNVIPAWMPDLANAGALEVLDPMCDKYGYSRRAAERSRPTYRDNQMKVGDKIFGFPDDGDVFLMYYRRTSSKTRRTRTRSRPSMATTGPRRRPEGVRRHRPVPDRQEPAEHVRCGNSSASLPTPCSCSRSRFRKKAASIFDADSMKATINSDIGVKVFTDMRNENKFMPPGVEQWGFVENLAAFLQGQTAMTISWPPYGRLGRGLRHGPGSAQLGPEDADRRQGRLCLAAGRHPELAAGFALSVSSTSRTRKRRICSSSG
jgi:multiple sugar transport system substrate-binding protein